MGAVKTTRKGGRDKGRGTRTLPCLIICFKKLLPEILGSRMWDGTERSKVGWDSVGWDGEETGEKQAIHNTRQTLQHDHVLFHAILKRLKQIC